MTSLKFIEPMYAKSVEKLPQSRGWLYEVKMDGYRCLAGRGSKKATLWSRRANVFTTQFPRITRALEKLDENTLIDGEIVAVDDDGRISFNLLQHHRSKARALQFYAFDLLIYRGRSLSECHYKAAGNCSMRLFTGLPILSVCPRHLRRSRQTIQAAKEMRSRESSPSEKILSYEPGKRSGAWLKYRINRGQEFVIGGYTPGHPFDALIVGYYEGSKLYYVGKVRNGFVPQVRREVHRKFKGLEIDTCPFANLPEKKRTMWALTREEMKNCQWLKPELVAQIEFAEWTPDGHLRHSKFVGLREDKDPLAVTRE